MAKYEIQVLQDEILKIQDKITEMLRTIKQTFILGDDKKTLDKNTSLINTLIVNYDKFLSDTQTIKGLSEFKNKFLGIKEELSDIYSVCKMQITRSDIFNKERMDSILNGNLK